MVCIMHAPLKLGGAPPCGCNPPWRSRRGPTRHHPQVLHALTGKGKYMTQLHEVTAGRALTTLPGPRGLPLVGNLFQLKVTQLQTTLEHWADIYGPLYTFRLGRKPVVVLAAPDLIQTVLRQRPETFRRMGVIARVLEDIGGNGLFAAEGTAWRRQRRVV